LISTTKIAAVTGAVIVTGGALAAFGAATGPAAGLVYLAEGGACALAAEVTVGATLAGLGTFGTIGTA
jgi:hypothetical protein